MKKIIDNKYKELNLDQKDVSQIFWKIQEFEGNAMGQIGESFIKETLNDLDISFEDDINKVIHDEYDVKVNGKKIEIKTATLGRNKTYQFNGINPQYNYDLIILLGVSTNSLTYKIIEKKQFKYDHHDRKNKVSLDGKDKVLVSMNPNNQVNKKLTLTEKHMLPIDSLKKDLIKEFLSNE